MYKSVIYHFSVIYNTYLKNRNSFILWSLDGAAKVKNVYGDKTSSEDNILVFMTQNHQNSTILTITIEFGERENRPEWQMERADNFLQKSKSFLRWILKRSRPKNYQNSTIFNIAIELGIFERENRPERQKERADYFSHR